MQKNWWGQAIQPGGCNGGMCHGDFSNYWFMSEINRLFWFLNIFGLFCQTNLALDRISVKHQKCSVKHKNNSVKQVEFLTGILSNAKKVPSNTGTILSNAEVFLSNTQNILSNAINILSKPEHIYKYNSLNKTLILCLLPLSLNLTNALFFFKFLVNIVTGL